MSPADLAAFVIRASLVASSGARALPATFADAIATESIAAPLFAGAQGAERSAALLTALAWFEGGNEPAAIGDCRIPDPRPGWHPCTEARIPQSFCALQINLPGGAKTPEGWGRAELLSDPLKCVRASLRAIRASIAADRSGTCPLCFYAGGADNSVTRRLSGHRMDLAKKLFALIPPEVTP